MTTHDDKEVERFVEASCDRCKCAHCIPSEALDRESALQARVKELEGALREDQEDFHQIVLSTAGVNRKCQPILTDADIAPIKDRASKAKDRIEQALDGKEKKR